MILLIEKLYNNNFPKDQQIFLQRYFQEFVSWKILIILESTFWVYFFQKIGRKYF